MNLNKALHYTRLSKTAWHYAKRPRIVLADSLVVRDVRSIAARRPSYGTRRMAVRLSRKRGVPINRKRMQKVFCEMGWSEPAKTKNEASQASARKLFTPDGPNQLLATDITYVGGGIDGWCYFNVIDVFTRRWLAYVLDTSVTTRTAIESIVKALLTIPAREAKGLRIRSDNGTQYTSIQYKKTLKILGVTGEYIWHHTPEQNGHIESFHKTLKKEYLWPADCARFQNVEEVVAKAFVDYNRRRIHSSLGYLTPDEFARKWKGGRNK